MAPRAALVALDLGLRLAGVDKAMAGQARAARATNTPLDVIVVNETATGPGTEDGVRYLPYSRALARLGRVSRFMKARLLASVPELRGYDAVFLRYPTGVDLDPLELIRRQRGAVVTIHHAKEMSEQLAVSRSAGTYARVAFEYVQGRRILQHVDGVIGVTDEIRDYQVARARRPVPSRTVANGVDVGAIAQTGFVPYDGRELRLVMMASSHAVWHGVDRLLGALRAYGGSRRIVLDMIGQGSGAPGSEEIHGATTIRHHGQLSGKALDDVMRSATLGISTLAFFRTGLRQAAVLKTREYIARGLPVVLGYDDVDLPSDCPFALQVPNDDSHLAADDLFAFAERVSALPDAQASMRNFAETVLDWRAKVPLFTGFAEELLASRRRR